MRPPVQTEMALLARGIMLHAAPHEALQLVQRVLVGTGRVTSQQAADPTWLVDGGRPVVGLEATPTGCLFSVHELAFLDSAPQGAQMWEWLRAQVETAAAAAGIPTSPRHQHLVQTQVIDGSTSIWSVEPAEPATVPVTAVPVPAVPAAGPGWPTQQAWPTPPYAPAPGRSTGVKILIALAVAVVGLVLIGMLAAIAIPVFLNQRLKAELAEVRSLTCVDVAENAVAQSAQDTAADGVALIAVGQAVLVADERATLQVPDAGYQSFVMTCSGSAVWADGIETPLTIDVYIDSELTQILDASWDE